MTRVALVFPGQGSQTAGMAEGLLDLPGAPDLLAAAAAAGLDLRAALAGDDSALRPTEVAQPALLFAGCVLSSLLPPQLEIVGVAGHSVGEYAALVAAGALSPVQAMELVVERGRRMAEMRDGTMAALLGADAELAEAVCAEVDAAGNGPVVVANLNAPGQVVLSGTRSGVEAAVSLARARGVRKVLPLNVSGAFHSPLMKVAAAGFAAAIDAATINDPRVPVVCNLDGATVRDGAGLRPRLRGQLVSPVRWVDCVLGLQALGCEALVELGPGAVLTGLARRIAPELRGIAAGSPAAVAALSQRLEAVTSG